MVSVTGTSLMVLAPKETPPSKSSFQELTWSHFTPFAPSVAAIDVVSEYFPPLNASRVELVPRRCPAKRASAGRATGSSPPQPKAPSR